MKKNIHIEACEIIESFAAVLDFFKHYADIAVLRFRIHQKKSIMKFIVEKFPNCVIRYENDSDKKEVQLFLKLNDETCSWLSDQNPFDIQIDGVKKMSYGITLSLYNSEKEIMYFSTCYQIAFIHDRLLNNEFKKYMVSLRKNKVDYIFLFIEKYKAYIKSTNMIPVADYFADIDSRALTAIFDQSTLGKYQLFDFYEEHGVMKVIAELLVIRVKNGEINTGLLYEWFMMHTMLSYEEVLKQKEIVGADIIYEYLRSIPMQEFLDSFPYRRTKFNGYFLDKISLLWQVHGYDTANFEDEDIPTILEIWQDEEISNMQYKKNVFSMYYNFANKYPTREERVKKIYSIRRRKYYLEEWHGKAERVYLFFYGIFVPKNLPKAFRLLKVASKDYNYDCQYDLARCYLNGWGTEKNIEQAKYWFGKASENGHPKAQEQLDLINKD